MDDAPADRAAACCADRLPRRASGIVALLRSGNWRGTAGHRHLGRYALLLSVSLPASPESLGYRRMAGGHRGDDDVAALRIRPCDPSQNDRGILHVADAEEVGADGARSAHCRGLARSAVQFHGCIVRPCDSLNHLFSKRVAVVLSEQAILQRRGVQCLRASKGQKSGNVDVA